MTRLQLLRRRLGLRHRRLDQAEPMGITSVARSDEIEGWDFDNLGMNEGRIIHE